MENNNYKFEPLTTSKGPKPIERAEFIEIDGIPCILTESHLIINPTPVSCNLSSDASEEIQFKCTSFKNEEIDKLANQLKEKIKGED